MEAKNFTVYQIFMIVILVFLQFTVVLDFMVLSPLGAILLKELTITTSQFGLVVSAYAFSAGASGLIAAGFADKFDRKKLLLFFYTGFVFGTFLCGIANSYLFLLIARVVTGIFGGVISSISFAIISDIFALQLRGRVMGFVQMAFSASQIFGIPIGLQLANHWGWHSPFLMIVAFSALVGVIILFYMQPVNEHLRYKTEKNAVSHLVSTLTTSDYLIPFLTTILLATGGYLLMPLGSAFSTNNLGIALTELPMLYFITGIFSFVFGPIIGKLSDSYGKYLVFVTGSIIAVIMTLIYTNLGVTPFVTVTVLNIVLFVGISSRIICSSALMTAVPTPQDRGAFMSINSSIQQISGGIAAACAGMIVSEAPDGRLLHYEVLGYIMLGTTIITVTMMYWVNKYVNAKSVPVN